MGTRYRSILAGSFMLLGFAAAIWGGAYGYLTVAGGDYRPALQIWALLSSLAVGLFIVAIWLGSRWIRWPSIVLLAFTCVVGLEPASRLFYLCKV